MSTFVLTTDERTIVNLGTLDGGPRSFLPVPFTPSGGSNVATRVRTPENSAHIPGDGSGTSAFSIPHTSQTGRRLIQCSWTGSGVWATVVQPGVGTFDTLVASASVPLVGASSYVFFNAPNPTLPIDASILSGGFIAIAPAAVGVAEQIDVVFEYGAPNGGDPNDYFLWAGTLFVTDY